MSDLVGKRPCWAQGHFGPIRGPQCPRDDGCSGTGLSRNSKSLVLDAADGVEPESHQNHLNRTRDRPPLFMLAAVCHAEPRWRAR